VAEDDPGPIVTLPNENFVRIFILQSPQWIWIDMSIQPYIFPDQEFLPPSTDKSF